MCQEHMAALAERLTRVEPEVSLSTRKSYRLVEDGDGGDDVARRRFAWARAARGRVVRFGWRARISARTILTKSRRRAAFGTSEDLERIDTW